jgi:hypothetical protein
VLDLGILELELARELEDAMLDEDFGFELDDLTLLDEETFLKDEELLISTLFEK